MTTTMSEMTASDTTVPIRSLIQPIETWNPSRAEGENTFDYVDLSSVDSDTKVITAARSLSCDEAPSRARQLVCAKDVLVSTVRPNLNGVASVPAELDGATASTGFCVLRCNGGKLDDRYLFHWVTSPEFVSSMVKVATGASYPAVSDRIILDSKIPVPHKNGKPDLDEQKRIAAILDRADAIRRKRQQALRLTDDFLRSVFLDMFGDPVTNPKGLEAVGLLDACKMTSGATPSKARKDYWDGDIPWISPKDMKAPWLADSIDHISDAALKETNIKLLKPNTVLIVIRGMILAHSFPVSQPLVSCTINQDMKGLVPMAGFNSHYVAWSLRCQFGNIMSKVSTAGHGTRRFDTDALRSLPVLKVDPISQEAFANIVESCRSFDQKTAILLRSSNGLFASLQQRAFRGEL